MKKKVLTSRNQTWNDNQKQKHEIESAIELESMDQSESTIQNELAMPIESQDGEQELNFLAITLWLLNLQVPEAEMKLMSWTDLVTLQTLPNLLYFNLNFIIIDKFSNLLLLTFSSSSFFLERVSTLPFSLY